MAQFDVFLNPIAQARRVYPYLVVLQSERARTGRERIVAPLVPSTRMPAAAGRLMPRVRVADVEHVVLVQTLSGIDAEDLRELRGQLVAHRESIVAALDYLFLGV